MNFDFQRWVGLGGECSPWLLAGRRETPPVRSAHPFKGTMAREEREECICLTSTNDSEYRHDRNCFINMIIMAKYHAVGSWHWRKLHDIFLLYRDCLMRFKVGFDVHLFSKAWDAHHKILTLLKGHFETYTKIMI